MVIAEGQHAELFNVILAAADRYLADHSAELREVFEGEAPRWVPDAVYRRVFDRLYSRLRERLVAMAADPDVQVTDLGKVPGLRCREDPPSQTPYVFFGLAPVHAVPVQAIVLRSVHQIGVQLVPRFGRPDDLVPAGSPDPRQRSFEPGNSPIRPVMREPLAEEPASGPGFLPPFGHRHSLPGASGARWGFGLPRGRPTGRHPAGPHRGCHVPHAIETTGKGVL